MFMPSPGFQKGIGKIALELFWTARKVPVTVPGPHSVLLFNEFLDSVQCLIAQGSESRNPDMSFLRWNI